MAQAKKADPPVTPLSDAGCVPCAKGSASMLDATTAAQALHDEITQLSKSCASHHGK